MNLFDSRNSENCTQRYVLDANYFIQASRLYYDLGVFPCFWKWTLKRFEDNTFILIDKVYQELTQYVKDDLTQWVNDTHLKRYVEKTDDIQDSYKYVINYVNALAQGKNTILNSRH